MHHKLLIHCNAFASAGSTKSEEWTSSTVYKNSTFERSVGKVEKEDMCAGPWIMQTRVGNLQMSL